MLFLAGLQNDKGPIGGPSSSVSPEDGPGPLKPVVSVTSAIYSGNNKLKPKSLWSNDLRTNLLVCPSPD
jgi:hypothetical protein